MQVRGGVVPPSNVLNTSASLFFIPAPGFTGNLSFGPALPSQELTVNSLAT